ncbi:N-acetylglucosaminyldiphosphoundecaprenol N-acetyl-beta-D-mannosaminyltransferase [Liquorilactobacillus sucicola DSM 21376 = JCM 15457]|uniref:N-acetylglucosaminyldiphosphoundecaprenol N-acetyl-beta-D-mannosaminyltransferase n=1 Tax=Liquorilactobacillus sucicola DSM 21376 = JCM 15457 TaxID=1423806 RepID=A0A0R2DPC3_9LACO|nr:WecB/TagA/CpsF family glycosyltransferase [Liquorilactobacillus sucicola]KRN05902.1 N-acetylglucosaminyldiphosphoundecaprenol N-acetyl-beta-D-mannosaminyltransferase [Liquorilactobacillus sucicola DSM 21376 = JCM 15457]
MSHLYPRVNILGINFTKITNQELLTQLKKDSCLHRNRFIVTANPEIVLFARKNKRYAAILNNADYTIADGIGIIKGAKLLNQPLPERVTGFDTLSALLEFANEKQKRVYFLGAKPEVITKLIAKVTQNYPQLVIAGYHDGYFKDEQIITHEIQQTAPDFVFVALGFPKQEFFINDYRNSSQALWMGVGGSFDVLAGVTKRAPLFWQKHHLEWFYRLLQEPSRFGRMLALPKYLLLILRVKFLHR